MLGILQAIYGGLGRFFTDKLAYFGAVKAIMTVLMVSVLPIVLKNTFNWIIEKIYSVVNTHVTTGSLDPIILQFTGVGAYLATHLQFQLCFSILITAVIVRFTLNMIPFVK